MSRNTQPTRRRFIGTLAGGAAAAATVTMSAASRDREETIPDRQQPASPNDQIQLALIGAGIQGTGDTATAITVPGVKLVAVCDLYDGRLTDAKKRWGQDLFTTRDYRQMLERPDIDAVIAAVPDHWHKQIAVDALGKNKSVYLEKPMVQQLGEGEAVIAAQKASKGILQVGSQGMSSLSNEKAQGTAGRRRHRQADLRGGVLGAQQPVGRLAVRDSAGRVGPDARLGQVPGRHGKAPVRPAPVLPVAQLQGLRHRRLRRPVRAPVLQPALHHRFDGPDADHGPGRPAVLEGRPRRAGRHARHVRLPGDAGALAVQPLAAVNFVDGTSGNTFLRMVGTGGAMDVGFDNEVTVKYQKTWDPLKATQGDFRSNPEPDARKDIVPAANIVYRAEQGYKGAHYDHFSNWFRAIRTGGKVVEDPVFGYRAAAPALACNMSYFEKRAIQWDPVAMKVTK